MVVAMTPRAVRRRGGRSERCDQRERDAEGHDGRHDAAPMRHGLGEDRLHLATIAARSGLCSRQMAARAARSKHRKPAAATPAAPPPSRDRRDPRDPRRRIYASLDILFAMGYAVAIMEVIPNRLPSAMLQLWTFPLASLAMAMGMIVGGRAGWWTAIAGGSLALASTVLLIVRIAISAAFLAGVYGAFGKAAATFALVMIALVIELVALLPIVQVKYLMSRSGRRALRLPP
jgi:cation transport ATPase